MNSVKFVNTNNDYTFSYDGKEVAEGSYTYDGFEVVVDNDFKIFENAMQALHYLNKKFAKHLYERMSLYENFSLRKDISPNMLKLIARRA